MKKCWWIDTFLWIRVHIRGLSSVGSNYSVQYKMSIVTALSVQQMVVHVLYACLYESCERKIPSLLTHNSCDHCSVKSFSDLFYG